VRIFVSVVGVYVEQEVDEIADARGSRPHIRAGAIGTHPHLEPIWEELGAKIGGSSPEDQLRAILQGQGRC
jgi:hypothetical protein